MIEILLRIRKEEDWLDWSKYAMVTRFCGNWERELPSIEDLIGKSPFSLPEPKKKTDQNTIEEWKRWAKETGLKCGGDT